VTKVVGVFVRFFVAPLHWCVWRYFIGKFAIKQCLSFFDNRVKAPDDSDIFMMR
jgi:hypothetical protein